MSTDTPEVPGHVTSSVTDRRGTGARQTEILKILGESGRFLTARQLHALSVTQGSGTGLSTVYRILRSADAAGLLEVVHAPSGKAYRLLPESHEHRLECRTCGEGVPFASEALEEWLAGLGGLYGFRDVRHALSVTGTCHACQQHTET
ncbi:Fur family transcriptional regulator [Streptomyces sp. NPDC096176]|uniref:Fur family transcriptional regulator n=1 Tax=Streptomyces sp. NPDC096176 TaxID=3366079 RepID=UPI0037F87185